MKDKMRFGLSLLLIGFMSLYISCKETEIYNPYSQLQEDIAILDKYLEENNIKAQKSASGLRYVIQDAGIGSIPKRGNQVKVHYTGTLLNGSKFDSSYDHDPAEPITYIFGYGQVIQGWEEGLSYIAERGKMTLYIPSVLAYGTRDTETIPSNSNLIFDVELISVQ